MVTATAVKDADTAFITAEMEYMLQYLIHYQLFCTTTRQQILLVVSSITGNEEQQKLVQFCFTVTDKAIYHIHRKLWGAQLAVYHYDETSPKRQLTNRWVKGLGRRGSCAHLHPLPTPVLTQPAFDQQSIQAPKGTLPLQRYWTELGQNATVRTHRTKLQKKHTHIKHRNAYTTFRSTLQATVCTLFKS